jgi:hypothetical protein
MLQLRTFKVYLSRNHDRFTHHFYKNENKNEVYATCMTLHETRSGANWQGILRLLESQDKVVLNPSNPSMRQANRVWLFCKHGGDMAKKNRSGI